LWSNLFNGLKVVSVEAGKSSVLLVELKPLLASVNRDQASTMCSPADSWNDHPHEGVFGRTQIIEEISWLGGVDGLWIVGLGPNWAVGDQQRLAS
jgi:hypothetical protein